MKVGSDVADCLLSEFRVLSDNNLLILQLALGENIRCIKFGGKPAFMTVSSAILKLYAKKITDGAAEGHNHVTSET